MNILAIDPGYKESAFVLFDSVSEKVIDFDFITNEFFILDLNNFGASMLAIESIEGFGMTAGQELFDTCFWSGRFCQAFRGDFQRIGRKRIKTHLCGNTTSKDKDIRESLIYRFGAPGTKKEPGRLYGIAGHCWSALAVAVTASDILNQK